MGIRRIVCAGPLPLKTALCHADVLSMPLAANPSFLDRKPAAWLVAGGIVTALTLSASCLAILMQ